MAQIRPVRQKMRIAILWAAGIAVLLAAILTRPILTDQTFWGSAIRLVGTFILIAAFVGRLWAILYIGTQKNQQVIQSGPYSMVRNPLYFFSFLGVIGALLLMGGLTLTLAGGTLFFAIFYLTAQGEAVFLQSKFGPDFDAYAARVPLFIPKPSLFQGSEINSVGIPALKSTFWDGLVFLAIIPFAEILNWLRSVSDFQLFDLY